MIDFSLHLFYFMFLLMGYQNLYSSQTIDTTKLLPITLEGLSVKGNRPHNADVWYIPKNMHPTQQGYIGGIFDGNGPQGKIVAEYIHTRFIAYFAAYTSVLNTCIIEKQIHSLLKRAFIKVRNDLEDNLAEDIVQYSGTTALILFRWNNSLYIAWTGDSKAVWGIGISEQTLDHNLSNTQEHTRLSETFYKQKKDLISNKEISDFVTRTLTKKRITIREISDNKTVSTELSRSFGIKAIADIYNIRPIPDIVKIDLSHISLIIAGSDGGFKYTASTLTKDLVQDNDHSFLYDVVSQSSAPVALKAYQLMGATIALAGKDNKVLLNALHLEKPATKKKIIDAMKNKEKEDLKDFINTYERILTDNTTYLLVQVIDESKLAHDVSVNSTAQTRSSAASAQSSQTLLPDDRNTNAHASWWERFVQWPWCPWNWSFKWLGILLGLE